MPGGRPSCKGKIYVADTYNHKIKVVDAKTGETKTIAGTGKPGSGDEPAQFHEPAGLAHAKGKLYVADTNNHLIRTLDLATGKVATLAIAGLAATGRAPEQTTGQADGTPAPAAGTPAGGFGALATPRKPSFKGAIQEKLKAQAVKAVNGKVKLAVSLMLPEGWKVNPLAPMSYWIEATKPGGPVDRTVLGRVKLPAPVSEFELAVPVKESGDDELTVSLNYYYCQEKDDGVCKVGRGRLHHPSHDHCRRPGRTNQAGPCDSRVTQTVGRARLLPSRDLAQTIGGVKPLPLLTRQPPSFREKIFLSRTLRPVAAPLESRHSIPRGAAYVLDP